MRYRLDSDDKTLAHNDAGISLSGSAGSGVLTKPKMTPAQEEKWSGAVAARSSQTSNVPDFLYDDPRPTTFFNKIYRARLGRTAYDNWRRPVV